MGFDKLAADLAGTSVLQRSLEAMDTCEEIDGLVVVAGDERRAAIESAGLAKLHAIVPGGDERHQSVANGLEALPAGCDLVAVHDAARPLVRDTQILACLAAAREHGAASLAHRIHETVKRADDSGLVKESLDRTNLWAMETPQAFRTDILREAYAAVLKDGLVVTDEVSALQHFGHPVELVENPFPNPKITLPADLELAGSLL